MARRLCSGLGLHACIEPFLSWTICLGLFERKKNLVNLAVIIVSHDLTLHEMYHRSFRFDFMDVQRRANRLEKVCIASRSERRPTPNTPM